MEEEVMHVIDILRETKNCLIEKNAIKLNELSNETIHSASLFQDAGSVTLAVLVYALSKLIERRDYKKVKKWDIFIKKINLLIESSVSALNDKKRDKYESNLEQARSLLTSISPNLRQYIKEVLRKASINKASKIYEHGISLGQTSKLLGISQWELLDYSGQKGLTDNPYNVTLDIKQRAKMALEFLS